MLTNRYSVENEVIRLRRSFHKYPELGWMEFKTTINIIEYLNKLGIKLYFGKMIHCQRIGLPDRTQLECYKKLFLQESNNKKYEQIYDEILNGYTGVVAVIDTGRSGNNTILRFDIDALPIRESHEDDHKPFREKFVSENDGLMHACGHDCHIAIGLTVARVLSNIQDKLSGKIYLIFQPAEEGVRGAQSMVESKLLMSILDTTDYFLSSHIGFGAQNGEIICSTDGFLGTKKIDVVFNGKSVHAGMCPEKGKNALLAACSCTMNLYSMLQYSEGISRLNVGKLVAGSTRNIIPDYAKINLEIRSDKESILNEMYNNVSSCVEGAALMYGVEGRIEIVGQSNSYNNSNIYFAKEVYDLVNKIKLTPIMSNKFCASEDVTYYMRKVEAYGGKPLYMIIGTDRKYPHHNEKFDINESNLINGVDVYVNILTEITNKLRL